MTVTSIRLMPLPAFPADPMSGAENGASIETDGTTTANRVVAAALANRVSRQLPAANVSVTCPTPNSPVR